jgi:hypothetical protein
VSNYQKGIPAVVASLNGEIEEQEGMFVFAPQVAAVFQTANRQFQFKPLSSQISFACNSH